MTNTETRRERRRRLTLTIAAARRADHLRRVHAGDAGQVDCVCELANTYFAKRTNGCNCRKRRKGNPRVAAGMCDIGSRDRIYEWRQEDRERQQAVRAGREFDEPGERRWPSSMGGPKLFGLETRNINSRGEPSGEWYAYRRYRTEVDRDNALRGLSRNVMRYSANPRRAVGYTGPRSEFRAQD